MSSRLCMFIASVGAVTLLASARLQAASANAPAACASLTSFKAPGVDIAVNQASMIPEGPVPATPFGPTFAGILPAYCRVDGVIDERTGTDGKAYAIGFAVAMPQSWNGRFLMQGGGGLNGNVALPIGSVAAGDVPALARGFAVVTTDSGHKSSAAFDASFFADQEATVNFLYQAVGKVAQVGKQIVAAYYGRAAGHSYFMGCSTGGREAMLMSQRYPRFFDGIVAGAPAMRTSFSNLADRWVAVTLNQVAPQDEQGRPQTSRALSDDDRKLVIDSLLKACDAKDGIVDGMIFDPMSCGFNPADLACRGRNDRSCLRPEQTRALVKAFAGPKDSRGNQVYPGFWFDTGIAEHQGIPGLLNPGPSPVGGPVVTTEMDVDKEAALAATPNAALGDTANWAQLNTFAGHGGKLIFFHGVSDPWFSAQDTARYYEQLAQANGGMDALSKWSRLFLVPGMGHCGGGSSALDHFDLIDSIVSWVEKDHAPESVVATGKAFPQRSRPLCPYPQHAHFKGSGDPQAAGNFECRPPG
ncbi:MAG: tannase/feruloyl esterase family alpha/beta hydrolase [Steroidobacteraceae bacterium]